MMEVAVQDDVTRGNSYLEREIRVWTRSCENIRNIHLTTSAILLVHETDHGER
jgi:hypothetical protein